MMRFLQRNLAALHIFSMLAAFTWICGGARADLLAPVIPWFVLVVSVALVFFPQNRHEETLAEARERVWKALVKDRLAWVFAALVALLAIPFLNRGLCPVCDADAIAAGKSMAPPVPFLPYCVDVADHYGVFLWFAPIAVATLATKHALLKRGKRLLLEMMVWNAVALALLGFAQQATGAAAPLWGLWSKPMPSYFFSVWGYPNMAGDYFVFFLAVAGGMWQHRMSEVAAMPGDREFEGAKTVKHRRLLAHYMLLAVGILYIAALDTLSRSAIILGTLVVGALAAHTFAGEFRRRDRAGRLRLAVGALFIVLAAAFVAVCCTPDELRKETSTLSTGAVLERVGGRGQYHQRVAMAIWRDHKLFGVGGWGYKHLGPSYMTDEELGRMQMIGGVNVHDDYIQFLCEHGAVGAGLIFAAFLLLVMPIATAWKRFYNWARFARPGEGPGRPYILYCMPAPVLWSMVGLTASLIHCFADCPFRTPAVLGSVLAALACADGYFPREK